MFKNLLLIIALFFSVTADIKTYANEKVIFNDPQEERDRRYIEEAIYKRVREIELSSSYTKEQKLAYQNQLSTLYISYIDPDTTSDKRIDAKRKLCKLLGLFLNTSRPLSRANSDSGYESEDDKKTKKRTVDYSVIDKLGKEQRAMKGKLHVTNRSEKTNIDDYSLDNKDHLHTVENIMHPKPQAQPAQKDDFLTIIATKAKDLYSYFFGK